jgi:hypothetical protein
MGNFFSAKNDSNDDGWIIFSWIDFMWPFVCPYLSSVFSNVVKKLCLGTMLEFPSLNIFGSKGARRKVVCWWINGWCSIAKKGHHKNMLHDHYMNNVKTLFCLLVQEKISHGIFIMLDKGRVLKRFLFHYGAIHPWPLLVFASLGGCLNHFKYKVFSDCWIFKHIFGNMGWKHNDRSHKVYGHY